MKLPFGQLVLLISLFVAGSSPAWAQQAPAEADDAVARDLFVAAERSVEQGNYELALQLFQQSFELSDRPELLFNAANAAERLGQDELAIELYTSYLERMPDAHNRPVVEARMRHLRRTTDTPPPAVDDVQGSSPNLWAWIAGSTTVAFTALGVAARVRGNSVFSDLTDECSQAPGCSDERLHGSSVQAWDRTTVISFSIAGAAAVGFVVALIAGRDTDEEDDTAIRVGVGPSSIQVGGTF